MAKNKKPIKSKDDTKVSFIILGLFVAGLIVFFIFSKNKESHKGHHKQYHKEYRLEPHKKKASLPTEGVDAYIPNVKSVEPMPAEPVALEVLQNIQSKGEKIAIIIDDWGQTTANCKYLKEIPEPMAVSILPGLRHTQDVAECAKLNGKLTMLHLPLEAQHNYDFYPPDYIIKTTMKQDLVSKIVEDDLAQLPSIEGVNNHMGSKATEDKTLMTLILKKLKKKGLFFVDSMTAHNTVCAGVADQMGLAFGKRDVFLDNINTREAITKQMVVLAQKALHKGYAVAIGHDRHLTMQVLKEEIPLLEKQGFHIVSIKTVLKNK